MVGRYYRQDHFRVGQMNICHSTSKLVTSSTIGLQLLREYRRRIDSRCTQELRNQP